MEQLLISIDRLRADVQLCAFARLFFIIIIICLASRIFFSSFLVHFMTIIIPAIEYKHNYIRQETHLLKIKQSYSCQVFFRINIEHIVFTSFSFAQTKILSSPSCKPQTK